MQAIAKLDWLMLKEFQSFLQNQQISRIKNSKNYVQKQMAKFCFIEWNWTLARISENNSVLVRGPLLCYRSSGIDVVGYPYSPKSSATSKGTKAAANNKVKELLEQENYYPPAMWYVVEVINPVNNKSALYTAILSTGATRSTFPRAWKRLEIETGVFQIFAKDSRSDCSFVWRYTLDWSQSYQKMGSQNWPNRRFNSVWWLYKFNQGW